MSIRPLEALKLKYDGKLTIATGKSRKEKYWKNTETSWSSLVARLGKTIRTAETQEEYKRLPKAQQDEIKDVGGFVGGSLKGGKRKAGNVVWRQLLALDADYAGEGFWEAVKNILDCACSVYSTHKHTPQNPRLRLIIPLSRPVTPDEYQAVGRRIAADINIEFFDDTTYQPHRLMYWPSTSQDGEFFFDFMDKPWLNPDKVLGRYPDWKDSSYWPESSRVVKHRKKFADRQGNPKEKPGMVGAFCRAYTVTDAIEVFLSEIYSPCEVPGRYTYIKGSSYGGLVIYDSGDFAYSHHGTDPVSGKLCNAFDLVRHHKFGNLDEDAQPGTPVAKLPSYQAMLDLAANDKKVRRVVTQERMDIAAEDFGDTDAWQEKLEITRKGEIKNTLTNMILIIRHDPQLKGIVYNEFRDGIDVNGKVPWKRLKAGWNKSDDASLAGYVDAKYKIYSPGRLKEAILKTGMERSVHPVKEYLKGLPPWDGVERVETLLVKFLGAEDNRYVRAATRKTLCAAVARIMEPGVKFDTVLVLNGPQGIGKSTLFAKLGGKWFSDSLSISDMRDKTAAEKLQGYWIIEIGELAGIRKVDEETLKSFLSRQDDKYRASYGFTVEDHPRQCIIVGSTNQEAGFLRDITGGRRFWPVKVNGQTEAKPWDIENVEQIWAEALALYKKSEPLFLPDELSRMAEREQIEALESDEREGIVREYLDMLLPKGWDGMDIYARRSYIRGDAFSGNLKGEVVRDKVCTLEIWCEVFGKEPSQMRKIDAYEINAIMRKIESWKKCGGSIRLPIYGKQRVFYRQDGTSGTKN